MANDAAQDRYQELLAGMFPAEELAQRKQLADYFHTVVADSPRERIRTLTVTHLLPERPAFLAALGASTDLVSVIPKPRSITHPTLENVARVLPVHHLSRADCADPDTLTGHLERTAQGGDVVLVDIGGYFADALVDVSERYSGRILGVVEDTENGFQRYERIAHPPCPIYSAARSPLKEPEDYLVGQSVAFSTEYFVRRTGDVVQGMSGLVIGYGKIGRSTAHNLRQSGARIGIYDRSAVKRAEARAHGYPTYASAVDGLRDAQLVIGATGNRSLTDVEFRALRLGAYVATVTSADDELDLDALAAHDRRQTTYPGIFRYDRGDRHFYLFNDGNAVNFAHDAVVGPAIHLVQAELVVASWEIQETSPPPGLHELDAGRRERIASAWMQAFEGEPELRLGAGVRHGHDLTADIVRRLDAYEAVYGPAADAGLLRLALDNGQAVTSRSTEPIHVTCSVLALDDEGRVLQIRHRTLDRWLYPGGHLEAGDRHLAAAGVRELSEETGIPAASIRLEDLPIHVDVHPIPANPAKGEGEHYHADFRFVGRVTDPAVTLQLDEVSDWRWAPAHQVEDVQIRQRLEQRVAPPGLRAVQDASQLTAKGLTGLGAAADTDPPRPPRPAGLEQDMGWE